MDKPTKYGNMRFNNCPICDGRVYVGYLGTCIGVECTPCGLTVKNELPGYSTKRIQKQDYYSGYGSNGIY